MKKLDINRNISVRQLPAGKLQNIKKFFEDGEKDTTEKPMPPTRPQLPPGKGGSPAHQPAAKKYPAPQAPAGQVKQFEKNIKDDESNDQLRSQKSGWDTNQPEQTRQVSKVAIRISSIENAASSLSTTNAAAASISHHKPSNVHQNEPNSKTGCEAVNNPFYVDTVKVQRALSDVSDLYAKVNKPNKNLDDENVTSRPKTDLQRKEAIRKNSDERRKTVATFNGAVDNNSVSVASRTKLFDSPKPTPPLKPDAIKRQLSVKTSQEQGPLKSESDRSQEGVYNQPWDKSSVIEDLKKKYRPPPSSGSTVTTNNATKCSSPSQKPPLPSQPPRVSHQQQSHEAANEGRRNSDHSKVLDSTSDLKVAAAPPKPPRTHAHDDYMKVKIAQSESKATPEVVLKKSIGVDEVDSTTEYLSVKDRISKMRQQTNSPPLAPNRDQNVLMRHQPPSRPPPPKLRPNSGGTPTKENPLLLRPRPKTQIPVAQEEGPVVIPLSPNSQFQSATLFSRKASQSRKPSDQLPPEPGKRFPLRKSFSSEHLHSSKSSSLNLDEGEVSQLSQGSTEADYEAVLDPDGYAIPHEFLKIPRKRQCSEQTENMNENVRPGQFLTKLQGFGKNQESEENGQFNEPWITNAQDQNLDKVTKKKMTMVKQKINQAYADVSISCRGVVVDPDAEWVHVEKDDSPEAEVIVEPTVLRKRIEYCATVRLKTSKSVKKSKEYLSAIYPQLFEYCLIVGLQVNTDKGYKPYIIHKFPENVSSNRSVPSFCFPDASVFKPACGLSSSESYSFVMTYEDGTHVYGYCRRMQPPDSSLPEVICIISPIDAFNMYNTLLAEIEKRRKVSTDMATELIAASFGRPLPKPGKICHIRTLDSSGEMETIYLNRQADSKLENVNYESPLRFLGTDKLVKVFASMLMERRIILCSSHLSVLTQTVHALAALLYPFQWQHVYVPILPLEMLDVVCAPMPYIIGVMTVFLPQVLKMDLEKVFIVDLDKKDFVMFEGDESTLLPHKVQKALKTAINMCKIDSEAQNAQWLMVAEAFLRMFIETIGHFANHIQTQQDGNRIFQKEGFISEVVSKEQRQFLEWFTETQMFQVFIDNHVEETDYGTSDLFMQRLTEYRETKEESRRKGLGAKVKNFKKALKTKLAS